jgi:sugar phosphate isomerase/epimerase
MPLMNRRTFIQSTIATAVIAAEPVWAADGSREVKPLGVQLYTVRTEMEKDFAGSIARVASVGYKEVEFAGYFNHTPQQVKEILIKNGLTAPSCHVSYDVVEHHLQEQIDACNIIGHKFIVCPWIEESQRKSPDGWKRAAELFNRAGEATHKAGIQFCYHNHTFEFQPAESLGGKFPYDLLLAETDKNLVKMEMDLCWISVAGQDPIAYFNKYPGRFPMVHVKDMKVLPKGAEGPTASPDKEMPNMTEVGSGVIDWKHIFANGKNAGIQHYIVEHDTPASPFDSIKKSYDYLHALRY